eukprot:snap_masked-scaffold_43-processed-gene-1.106-mRNA-1 protein AED:0.88 eAED:1.00 QI:0/-1/0/1/-1/1/1/0/258
MKDIWKFFDNELLKITKESFITEYCLLFNINREISHNEYEIYKQFIQIIDECLLIILKDNEISQEELLVICDSVLSRLNDNNIPKVEKLALLEKNNIFENFVKLSDFSYFRGLMYEKNKEFEEDAWNKLQINKNREKYTQTKVHQAKIINNVSGNEDKKGLHNNSLNDVTEEKSDVMEKLCDSTPLPRVLPILDIEPQKIRILKERLVQNQIQRLQEEKKLLCPNFKICQVEAAGTKIKRVKSLTQILGEKLRKSLQE